MTTPLSFSVIICTKDRADDVRLTLPTLLTQTRPPDELIVIDSSADAETRGIVESFDAPFPVIYEHTDPGLTYQRNRGIARASGEVVHFLDDDVTLMPRYFEAIQEVYARDAARRIGGVGGALVDEDFGPVRGGNRLGQMARTLFLLSRDNGRAVLQRSGLPAFAWNRTFDDVTQVTILCGALCSYRREVFDRVRFDEWFEGYSYMEDVDLSHSVARNWQVMCAPEAKLHHRVSTSGRMNRYRLSRMRVINRDHIWRKHVRPDWRSTACRHWSSVGLILFAVAEGLRHGDWNGLRGTFAGLRASGGEQPISSDDAARLGRARACAPTSSGTGRR